VAWNGSGWFGSWYAVPLRSMGQLGNLLGNNIYAALFNGTPTPDPDPGVAARYGVAPWAYAAEVAASTAGWPSGGKWLRSMTVSEYTDPVAVRTGDTTISSNNNASMTAHGDMCYDKGSVQITNMGWCYHDYGGPVVCLSGTFSVVWHAAGVAVIDCAVT
jgi:hypothetical protein